MRSNRLVSFSILIMILFISCVSPYESTQWEKGYDSPQSSRIKQIEIWHMASDIESQILGFSGWIQAQLFITNINSVLPFSVNVKANGLDFKGNSQTINPVWTSSDTSMVNVVPTKGPEVNLTIIKEGKCNIYVEYEGVTETISVEAYRDDLFHHLKIIF